MKLLRAACLLLVITGVGFGQCGSAGKLVLNPLTGLLDCTASSSGTAVAPYSTTFSSQTSVSISAATHGQGTLAVAQCFDASTPRVAVACSYTRNSSGDLVFTFSPSQSGQIEIGSGGGSVSGSGNPAGATGTLQYNAGSNTFGGVTSSSVSGANVTLGGTLTMGTTSLDAATGNITLGGTLNKLTVTAPATAATLTLANNSSLITAGAFTTTLTSTATTNFTFPAGTTTGVAGGNNLTTVGSMPYVSASGILNQSLVLAITNPGAFNETWTYKNPVATTGATRMALSLGAGDSISTVLLTNAGRTSSYSHLNQDGGFFYWFTRTVIGSSSDGTLQITNNGISAGVTVDAATDSILKIRNRANNADAAATMSTITMSGASFLFNGHTCTIVSTVVTCP